MPDLEIDGIGTIEVGENFTQLSSDEQNSFVQNVIGQIQQDTPTQPEAQTPEEPSRAGEMARPLLQAAKNIAVGTVGGLGDLAQEAFYAPEIVGRSAARGLGMDVEPFDASKVNTVSPMIREGFDKMTGGLTAPRSKGEEISQTVGEIAGGIVGPGAIKTAATKAVDVAGLIGKRALQAGAGLKGKAQELVKAFEDTGVKPTLANIAEGQTTKTFQNLLGNFPGSRGVIEKATQSQIDDITKQLAGITKSEGGTVQQTGKVIQEGAEGIKEAGKVRINKLYDDLDQFIAADKPTPTANLSKLSQDPAIEDVVAVGSGDTAKVLNRYSEIVDEAGNISYPRLKTFRSTIGAKLQSPALLGEERGALKRIYGALSEDMKGAIQGEKGLQAFNKANNAFKRQTQLLDKTLDPLIKAKTPEKVYDLALSGSKQGGTNIRAIMKRLKPEQQEFVRGTVTKRMGLAQPGQQDAFGEVFSPNKFLTEWNRLSPEARSNIFTKPQAKSIENLNKVTSLLKDTSKARQASNNLPYAAWAGLGGLTVASPIAGGGAVAGANITARMMTNPRFVRWLAQAPKVRNAEILKHLKQLSIISGSAKSPALSEDILDYIDSITTQENNGDK